MLRLPLLNSRSFLSLPKLSANRGRVCVCVCVFTLPLTYHVCQAAGDIGTVGWYR
ncbi:hypothetical protein LZ30DRAFT_743605, partial [Colletotrichum cereale]